MRYAYGMGDVVKVPTEALQDGLTLEARRDEPLHQVEALVQGWIRALLVGPDEGLIAPATLAWTLDGEPVTAADLPAGAVLPEAIDEEGLIEAAFLPLGRWAVTPTVEDGPAYAEAGLAWVSNHTQDDAIHHQRVRYATRPEPEQVDDEHDDEDLLGVIHAALVDRRGQVLTSTPLTWWINGHADGDGRLPTQLPADGVLTVSDLPPGVYHVEPRPAGPDAPRYKPARLAWCREQPAEPLYQRLRLAP